VRNLHPANDEERISGEENPYESPSSQSDFAKVSILRVFMGLLLGAITGGVGFCTTCGGIGFAAVTNFGLYSTSPIPKVIAILGYVLGGIVGLWLFFKVFRSFVS
jgi:hypothetical protein